MVTHQRRDVYGRPGSGERTQEIREAEIDNSTPWSRKHWRSIEWNYRRAPHFKTYADRFHELYERPWKSSISPGDSSVPAKSEPSMTTWAPAASALATSPE